MKLIALVLLVLVTDVITIALCKAAKRGDRQITERGKEHEEII